MRHRQSAHNLVVIMTRIHTGRYNITERLHGMQKVSSIHHLPCRRPLPRPLRLLLHPRRHRWRQVLACFPRALPKDCSTSLTTRTRQ